MKFENLLIDELAFVMRDNVRVQGALFLDALTRLSLSSTSSGKGETGEASLDGQIIAVVAILATDVDNCCFGGNRRGTNHDTRNADKVRDICRIQVPNRDVSGGGVQKELVSGELNVSLGGVDDPLRTLLESCFELEKKIVRFKHQQARPATNQMLTRGMMSAGSVVSLCASSSL